MKKILVLFVALLFVSPAWSNEYFNMGRNAYNLGQYGEAKELLELAVRNKPKNITYKYYYAQTLLQLGMVDEAAEQYQAITLASPNSHEGMAASRVLNSMNKYFENKAGEFKLPKEDEQDYIAFIIFEDNKMHRWKKGQLSVYIQSSDSSSIAQKAFETWSNKVGNIISFNFVPTKELADITFNFTDKMPLATPEYGYIKGYAYLKKQDKSIVHADITVQDTDTMTKEKFSPDEIYATSLHEIGHALGLSGHSENPKDIMYNELTNVNKTVSARDANTLKRIYQMETEAIAELSSNPTVYSIKLKQAQDYAKAYPNLYTSWSNLASSYVAIGDYNNAVDAIKKAIEIKVDDPALYTQLGGYYLKLGMNNEAIETYKYAYDLQPDNKVYLFNWAKACYKNKRADEAKATVDSYLLGDGFLANDEISRSLRRMYKQDKEKEKEKIIKTREDKEKKLQEMQEFSEDMSYE